MIYEPILVTEEPVSVQEKDILDHCTYADQISRNLSGHDAWQECEAAMEAWRQAKAMAEEARSTHENALLDQEKCVPKLLSFFQKYK